MVGAANDEYTIVIPQTVHLIEKVASHEIGDERVQVLEDKIARCILSSHPEDLADGILGSGVLCMVSEMALVVGSEDEE